MLENNTILITGGGSGIGKALALQLANRNKIIICGRREVKLKEVASKNENISYEVADISDHHSIEELFTALQQKGTVLDVIFNNAGVTELWDLNTMQLTTRQIFDKVNTNLSGAVAINQYFINQANSTVENLIVNITTEIAIFPIPVMPLYSASKAGLSIFTQALRAQLKSTKFRVVEVLPPGVDTAMPKEVNNTGKLMSPEDFARNTIKSIRRGKMQYAPGKNVLLFKFFRSFLPGIGLNIIDKISRKQLSGNKAN